MEFNDKSLSLCVVSAKISCGMAKVAEYIKQIEIDSLWNGRKHILWNLRKDVNILSGVNGVGKSTILNSMAKVLSRKSQPGAYQNGDFRGVRLTFEPADSTMAFFDIVSSFDGALLSDNVIGKLADGRVRSELDWRLYELQRRYLNFQVNQSRF